MDAALHLSAIGIRLNSYANGEHTSTCPECSPRRKKKMDLTEKDISRFHDGYTRDTRTGCWNWNRETNKNGRARIWAASAKRCASHVALAIAGKPRPHGEACALHSCDNPRCVNPAHLSWDTQAANIADRVQKGRSRAAIGTSNASAKMTPELVLAIRADARSASAIARDYGVWPQTIIHIRSRKTWSHV